METWKTRGLRKAEKSDLELLWSSHWRAVAPAEDPRDSSRLPVDDARSGHRQLQVLFLADAELNQLFWLTANEIGTCVNALFHNFTSRRRDSFCRPSRHVLHSLLTPSAVGGRLPHRESTDQADHLHMCRRVPVPKLVKRVRLS
jgi:hypothetical protein